MARSPKELLVPILFLVEGAFWLAIMANGGGLLLLFGALTGIISGLLLVGLPKSWVTRPMAGGSALFGLTLTVFQLYQSSTLLGSTLNGLGATSGAIFAVVAVVCVYLELQTLAAGNAPKVSKKA